MSGAYAHQSYAESLFAVGSVLRLPDAGGHLIVREIPESNSRDAVGPYPLFMCSNWDVLGEELSALGGQLVSVTLVADPFGEHGGAERLREHFPDRCIPFKTHHVMELYHGWEEDISTHHLRNARKGLRHLRIEVSEQPEEHLDDWWRLYERLITRHTILGVARFSRESFARQLRVPGVVMFRAVTDAGTVGAVLWYRFGDRAYYHLAAYDAEGYDLGASHATFLSAMRWLCDREVRWLNLGGGAGVSERADDGLSRFKAGWANTSRTAYLCGRILDRHAYEKLTASTGGGNFFPAYRAPAAAAVANGQ